MVIEVGEEVGWQFGPGALRYLLAEGEEFGFEGASGKGGRLGNRRGFSLRRGSSGCAISGRGDGWRARHRFSLARRGAALVRAPAIAQIIRRKHRDEFGFLPSRGCGRETLDVSDAPRCGEAPRQGLFANEFLQMPIFLGNSGNLFGSADLPPKN